MCACIATSQSGFTSGFTNSIPLLLVNEGIILRLHSTQMKLIVIKVNYNKNISDRFLLNRILKWILSSDMRMLLKSWIYFKDICVSKIRKKIKISSKKFSMKENFNEKF